MSIENSYNDIAMSNVETEAPEVSQTDVAETETENRTAEESRAEETSEESIENPKTELTKDEKRARTDDSYERKLLADYALKTSTGEMTGDEFIEHYANDPDARRDIPKRVLNRVISKLSKGKFESYEDYSTFKNMPEEQVDEYEKLNSHPVIKEMKEIVKTKERETLYKLANEMKIDVDELEDEYLNNKVYDSIYNSLVKDNMKKEDAMRFAIRAVNPNAFNKKEEIETPKSVPPSGKKQNITEHVKQEKKSVFTSRSVNPLTDW